MIKAYIIMTQSSRQFVEKLTPALKGVAVIDSLHAPRDIGDNLGNLTKERIKAADIILIVVDGSFVVNTNAKTEMHMAMAFSSQYGNPSLYPILLDEAPLPEELTSIMCARCRSDSDSDIQRLSVEIQKTVADKKKNASVSSKERKSILSKIFDEYSTVAALMSTMMAVFATIIPFVLDKTLSSTIFGSELTFVITLVIIGTAMGMLVTTYASMMKRRKTVEERAESEQYSKKLKEAIAPTDPAVHLQGENFVVHYHQDAIEISEQETKSSAPEIDALGRMLINLEDIKEFYTWSQKQAKGSFRLAIAMCIGGFVLMVAAILLPIVFGLNIEMAIIPAIGGAIAELVAGTALFVYRSSLSQLNHYHKALHEDERFLSSVNLLNQFSTTETQDKMLEEIIRSEIQMNLISISINEPSELPKKKVHEKQTRKQKEEKEV